jgi:dodecin
LVARETFAVQSAAIAGSRRFVAASSRPTGGSMATKKQPRQAESGVYRVIDVIGTSPDSWEDAARSAVETAGESLRDLRIAEVARLDVRIEDGKVVAYRARLQLSFKYEGEG